MAQAVHPYRMVIVSASFPYKAQLLNYQQALKKRNISELFSDREGLMPSSRVPHPAHRALDARGKVVENWTKIDLEKDLMAVLSHATGFAPLEANETYLQPVAFDGLVIARPKLAHGEYPKPDLKLLAKASRTSRPRPPTTPRSWSPHRASLANLGSGQTINIFGGTASVDDHGKGPMVPLHGKGPMGRDDSGKDEKEKTVVFPEYCLVRFCDCNNIQPG